MIFLKLFLEFFKTGLFAIGGGLATIPFLKDIAVHYTWYTLNELTNMIAISESTPGPIGVNMATFAGIKAAGPLGGIISTFSLVLPSFVIIIIISKYLEKYKNSKVVVSVFNGIRPCTCGLILSSIVLIAKQTIVKNTNSPLNIDIISVLLIAAFVVLMNIKKLKNIHPAIWILSGGVLGILLKLS